MSRQKIAVILSRFPYPLDKGDKLRAYHQLKELSKLYDIHLFALTDIPVNPEHKKIVAAFCQAVHIYPLSRPGMYVQSFISMLKGIPLQVGYFFQPHIRRKIHHELSHLTPDLVYCQLSRTARYAVGLPYTKIIDLQDAFSANYHRIQMQSRGLRKIFYQRESRLMKLFEENMLDWFDAATIISDSDKNQINRQPNELVVVPNGVDTEFFKPQLKPAVYDLLFSGNLSYLPNQHALSFLLEKILPRVVKSHPELRVNIAGADMPEALRQYASSNVTLSGWVNDIRDAYAGTKIFVAPLFTGAGLQNKLLEAMSMGIPCITSTLANSSLQAIPEKEILIADDAESFVFQINRLISDPSLRNLLSASGREFICRRYSWAQANAPLRKLLADIMNDQ
ncbi:MAG: glycosyltransferase [Chitinophagaceae bacterium]|nr:glycosyltransferase [Chitinophagaceae bacterium]